MLDHAHPQGTAQRGHTISESVNQWISEARHAYIESFFEQGLWLEDEFPRRLKVMLNDIQMEFPMSCRTDVNNLGKEQQESLYKVFVAMVASSICLRLTRDEWFTDSHLINALIPECGRRMICELPQECMNMIKVFVENGVLGSGPEYSKMSEAEKNLIVNMLMAGPNVINAPLCPTSPTNPQTDDSGLELPPIIQDASVNVPPIVAEQLAPKPSKPRS